MTVLLAGGLMTLIVMAFLIWPFFRKDEGGDAADREIFIYEDQLAELARDEARGTLAEEQAKGARTEIERRLAGALRRKEQRRENETSRAGRLAVVAVLAATPLAAALLYLQLGSPAPTGTVAAAGPAPTVSAQQAAQQLAAMEQHPELLAQIEALEARLRDDPSDAEGFALLARSYGTLRRYDDALGAYQEANRLVEGRDARLAGEMAEVMVLANEGFVSPEARSIFALINEDFPTDPQSTYYLALAKAQEGDEAGAVADLMRLRENSPQDAPWLPAVDELLRKIAPAQAAGSDDRRFSGPSAEQVAAAQAMTSDQQAQMIEGMVSGLAARLEENPDDVEGWRRLARAYEALGRTDEAANAHREVLARAPDDAAAKAFLSGLE